MNGEAMAAEAAAEPVEASLTERYLGSVQTWECDTMGHMNVQFYCAKAWEAEQGLFADLGLGRRARGARGLTLRMTDQHIRFHKELRAGTPFRVASGIAAIAPDGLRIYHELQPVVGGGVATTLTNEIRLADRNDPNRSLALPDEVLRGAEAFRTAVPAHGRARGLDLGDARPAPRLDDPLVAKMVPMQRGAVMPHECDEAGLLRPQGVMGRFSDGIPALLGNMLGWDRSSDPDSGGAALEYRIVVRRPAMAGDVLCCFSGIVSISGKPYTWAHWMFDAESGEAVATAINVGVHMDLRSRRATPLPEPMRGAFEAHIVDGLSV
ncbi:thioesterase family protein [Marinibaculum pumilum]|uniref:Thioesterase family protein n=1 Tax=Marinibaculum pumilum TaxID=1766165 RepID=A0ABV7KWL7_9PROT